MRSSLTLSVHCDNTFMGSWNGKNSGSICKRDMWTSHGMSHCSMGPWDMMDNPTVPWDHGMGWTVGHTHASVEGQVSHGTVGWDGQFTAFLDIYAFRQSVFVSGVESTSL